MSTCYSCGSNLPQDLVYCPWCGMKTAAEEPAKQADEPLSIKTEKRDEPAYCGGCGAKLPAGCSSCLICGLKAGDKPVKMFEAPTSAREPALKSKASAAKNNRDIVSVCVFICLLLSFSTVALLAVRIFPIIASGEKPVLKDAVIYQTADEKLKINSPALDAPMEIVSGFTSKQDDPQAPLAKKSPDNRYIAYLNGYTDETASGTLHLLDFSEKASGEGNAFIEADVLDGVTGVFFFMNGGGALAYLKSGGELFLTEYGEAAMLDSGVVSVIDSSDTHILYEKRGGSENGEAVSVFLYSMDKDGGKITLIDENITSLADYTPGFDKFIYMREQSQGSFDIMAHDLKTGDYSTLAIGADHIITADAATSSALFVTASLNTLRYENIVIDDHIAADKDLREPDIFEYPLLSEYFEINGADSAGAALLEEDEELADESLAFKAVMEAYDAKLDRDRLRVEINSEISSFVSKNPVLYDLHLTSGGNSTLLAKDSYTPFAGSEYDPSTGLAIWVYTNWRGIDKISIDSFEKTVGGLSLSEYLTANMSDSLYICPREASPATARIGDGAFYSRGFELSENQDGIYFAMGFGSPIADNPDNMCSLYYAPISEGRLGTVILIDERVFGVGEMLSGGRLVYYKERIDNLSGLYLTNGADSVRIGENVSLSEDLLRVLDGNETLIYLNQFNESRKTGDLFMMTKQTRHIAGDVKSIYHKDGGLVYFLRGAEAVKAELYSFGPNGLSRIDEGVAAIIE